MDIHPFSLPSQWVKVKPGCDIKLKEFCVLMHPAALSALATDMPASDFLKQMSTSWKLVDRDVPLIE
jgi:hypothetical protein